jgi:DNA-binding transcriptional LysR family regulator
MVMEFKQLYYFNAVCKYGSFSKAAENIYVTQQALSKSIIKLEKEIDLPLLYRSKNGVTPTKYGTFLLKHSQKIINELDFISRRLKQMHNNDFSCYTINICFASGMAMFVDLTVFKKFQLKYPNINILLTEDSNFECERKVLSGEIDAAISISPIDENKFDVIWLKSYNMMAIVNADNELASKKEITFNDLKNQPLICISNKTYYFLLNQFEKAGFMPDIVFSSMDVVSIYKACSENNFIGFGAENILNSIFPLPSVRIIPFKNETFKINIYFITRKQIKKPKPLKTLITYLSKLHN